MKMMRMILVVLVWLGSQGNVYAEEEAQRIFNFRQVTCEGQSECETYGETNGQSELETYGETNGQSERETNEEINGQLQQETSAENNHPSEQETQRQTETVPESGETDTEKTEEKRVILISHLWPAYENGYKIYDGTNEVELEADVMGLESGVHLELWGVTECANPGIWKVEIQTKIWTDEEAIYPADVYEVRMEESELELFLTIQPKPLTIIISDGVKYYFDEMDLEKVEFLSEDGPIQVTGFVEDQVPEGFVMPEITWNPKVIQKESPMYHKGERAEYKGALVVKTKEDGTVSGNATDNYCFVLDEESGYYETGSIFLREPVLLASVDYSIQAIPKEGAYRDDRGILWLQSGCRLQMCAQTNKGFNQGIVSEPLRESGAVALQLYREGEKGEIVANSQSQSIPYQIDGEAPQALIGVEGVYLPPGEVQYQNHSVTCGILNLWDDGSGIGSVQICAVKGELEGTKDPMLLYTESSQIWQPAIQTVLTEEGVYTIMARLEDRVGNVRFVKSGQIILDWTKPKLEIQGLESGSANNDTVAPFVFCQDESYEKGSLTVVLQGTDGKERTFAQERMEIAYGEQVQIFDIPRERRWDDLYLLKAEAVDLAGNAVEKKIVFSVNRFGSVYFLDTRTREKLSSYYMKEPMELVVREFNIDTVLRQRIRSGHGHQLKWLVPQQDYLISHKKDAQGFHEYCYRISADNFIEEGAYYVVLATADRAQNVTDSQRQKLKMEFSVDRTNPMVLISGVEEQGIYGKERVAVIACQDNQYLEQICVYLNGQLVAENQEKRQNIPIKVTNSWQSLKVQATDGAGNMTVSEEITFYMGKNPEERTDQKKEQIVKPQMRENQADEFQTNQSPADMGQPETEKETAFLQKNEQEILRQKKAENDGIFVVCFLGIAGIIGGYLYKIKKAKE